MSDLRRLSLYRVLSRPNLVLGCDRELVLSTALVAVATGWLIQTWIAIAASLALWLFAVAALRLMAKADPLMRQVYLRHVRLRSVYPAHASVWARR